MGESNMDIKDVFHDKYLDDHCSNLEILLNMNFTIMLGLRFSQLFSLLFSEEELKMANMKLY
jgi:hypothetical protein